MASNEHDPGEPSVTPEAEGERRQARAGRPRLLWGAAIVGFWALVLVGAVLAGIGLWVRRTFGPISVDQLLSNLPGGGGAGAGGGELITGAVVSGLVVPVASVLAAALVVECGRRALRRRGAVRGLRTLLLRGIAAVLAVVVPLGGASLLGSTIGLSDYVQALMRENATGVDLADYYVEPRPAIDSSVSGGRTARSSERTGPGAGERKNLVVIYLESVEDSLADDKLFGRNMLAPVQRATEGWASIPSLQQYDGGGWTMAGIVSTQCGIPLRTASALTGSTELNNLGTEGNEVGDYMGGATCLGDVLANEGYRNVYLGGADGRFAGKEAFLRTHGYDDVYGLSDWRRLGETEVREDWGLSDRRLFARAREEVTRLYESGDPFNLTMLTLDTHEGPRVYEYCDWNRGSEAAMTAITSCSMQQVSGFVDYLDKQGYLKNTAVVLMGDHRKMIAEGGSFWKELKGRENRTVFNRVWSPDGARFARNEIDQFSMYPTLLELAGIELQDRRAGIGVSALAAADEVPKGTILDLSDQEYEDLVRSRSVAFYRELWG
ncbi:LTA synthase family protein [Leucobacter sp. wl10]|uniref:LTA synthase family protein n=1 Tax=Leucobacter sp. wl10 TaxID=2304677 RepID=UPI000E5B69AC|nr:LTA synthase family protein [Leucobacter sp. wl10]RGE23201.1 LTA synthase family protein [Leucobacter sp. wl10]